MRSKAATSILGLSLLAAAGGAWMGISARPARALPDAIEDPTAP